MNADRLLAHFEKISEAPDAVEQLRRFVLDLAVRGKLVEQDSREGTAQDLLALHGLRIGETAETPPFPVPQSWTWLAIGDVCSKTGSGSTPRGGKAAYKSSGIPFLRSQNVHDDGLKLDDVAFIDAATHHRMTGTAVQPDDLLLNITGGSMGRCCRVPSTFVEGNVSQHVAILRAAIPGTQAFLHQCIISAFFQTLIFDEQTGAGRGGLPKNKMDRLPIPLPPLAEQHRIVKKVDELMMLCDRLEASHAERETRRDRLVVSSLSRLGNPSGSDSDEFKKDAGFHLRNLNRLSTKPEHIKELRKAILNLAVNGWLTESLRKSMSVSEDGHALLKRLLAERRSRWEQEQTQSYAAKEKAAPSKWQSRYPDPATPCSESLPTLPEGWAWATIEQISSKVTDGVHKKPTYVSNGVPFLKVTNLTAGPGISFASTSFVSEADHREFCRRTLPEKGDLLVTKDGTLGVVRAIRTDRPFSIFVSLALVKPLDTDLTDFLEVAMASPVVQQQMIGTGSGLQHIHLQDLRKDCIPLPPLAEQKQIVAKVDELMAICDQLEKQLESQQRESRRLLEALLHEALEGVG